MTFYNKVHKIMRMYVPQTIVGKPPGMKKPQIGFFLGIFKIVIRLQPNRIMREQLLYM